MATAGREGNLSQRDPSPGGREALLAALPRPGLAPPSPPARSPSPLQWEPCAGGGGAQGGAGLGSGWDLNLCFLSELL